MQIELGVLNDGGVVIVCDKPLPQIVKRVEYYVDQRLFMMVYKNEECGGDLMHFEIPYHLDAPVTKTPDILIYTLFENEDPLGYNVPLIKVHN